MLHVQAEDNIDMHMFKDDNCRVLGTKSVCDWFHFDCPAKSPDLNPIENLWDCLEEKVKCPNRQQEQADLHTKITKH